MDNVPTTSTDYNSASPVFSEEHEARVTVAPLERENEENHLEILMAVVPIVVPIIFTLIIIIGFIGNLLLILVVILNKTMRSTTNILIFNLAVSIS